MDLIEKMIEAIEAAIVDKTSFKKLDVSLGKVTNIRPDYDRGFSVMPTTLEQDPGGVGFIFFRQGFEIRLFEKLAFRGAARQKIFSLYSELEKLYQSLYTIRVTGDNYQVVLVDQIAGSPPVYSDNYAMLSVSFSAKYRRTNIF